jgi:hypothetical protein
MEMHAASLYRLMRALAEVGVLTEDDGNRFALTATGQLLRSDVPGSFRAMAILLGRLWHHTAWASLAHSVRTGESAFIKIYGVPHFEWLQTNSEEGAIFNEAMTSLTGVAADAVTEAYDFSGLAKIADVGGGHGLFISKILKANPDMTGIVFDLPHVAEGARKLLGGVGLSARFLEQLLQSLGHRYQRVERQQIRYQVIVFNEFALLIAHVLGDHALATEAHPLHEFVEGLAFVGGGLDYLPQFEVGDVL